MKDLLDHIGLTEIFAYLCPGAVVLCSLGLWLDEVPTELLKQAKDQQVLAIFVVLVTSYSIGLVIAVWGAAGGSRFVSAKEARAYSSVSVFLRFSWFRYGYPLLWLLHSLPLPRQDDTTLERLMQLGERMERYGLRDARLPPWEFLTTYRTIASGAMPECQDSIEMSPGVAR